jgi:hypothetical protein
MEQAQNGELLAPINDTTIISFDGRIIEVFGYSEAHRYHAAQRPRMSVGKRMASIEPQGGAKWSFFYDRDRREVLEAFAERVNAAIDAA